MALGPIDNYQPRIGLAPGTTAAADITVTGCDGSTIQTTDTITAVWCLTTAALIESCADLTSEASITAAGIIQCATTDTSSNQLIVFWHDSGI